MSTMRPTGETEGRIIAIGDIHGDRPEIDVTGEAGPIE